MRHIGLRACTLLAAMLFAFSAAACRKNTGSLEPAIEVAPIEQSGGQWKIAGSDTVTLTVTAPGATEVKLLYRPVISTRRNFKLKTLGAPTDPTQGKFSTDWNPQADFVGCVWAEVSYPDGAKKKTGSITPPCADASPRRSPTARLAMMERMK